MNQGLELIEGAAREDVKAAALCAPPRATLRATHNPPHSGLLCKCKEAEVEMRENLLGSFQLGQQLAVNLEM